MSYSTTHFILSVFLLISLCLRSSFGCYFYLDKTSPNVTTDPSNCMYSSTPCTSYCQIINYINTLNSTSYCSINLLSDYVFSEVDNCQLSTKLYSLTFIGGSVSGKINYTLSFQTELKYDLEIVQYLYFYTFNISNARIISRNINFNNCIVNGYTYQNNIVLESFVSSNSFLKGISFVNIAYISFKDSIIDGANLQSFQTLFSDNCTFMGQTVFSSGNFISIQNGEFLSEALTGIVYVTSVTLENTIFHKTNSPNGALEVRYCQGITIKNTKVYSKENWAILTGINSIVIDNLYSTTSLEMLLPIYVQISNSQFVDSPKLGLRLTDASYLIITNTNFTNCYRPIMVENIHSSSFQATISDCFFTQNSGLNGGAINIVSNIGETKLTNCVFTSNSASANGGALYLSIPHENSKYTIENCKFIKNYAGGISISDTNEGNGGAIYAAGKLLELSDDTIFSGNSAIRGGAIYTNSFIPKTNALIKSNVGRLAGGGIFLFNVQVANNNNFNFQNNSALLYGIDKASYIKKIIVQYSNGQEIIPELNVFPGLQFDIVLKVYDIFDNPISSLLEQARYLANFDEKIFTLITVFSNPRGLYRFYLLQSTNYTLPSHGEEKNFTLNFPETSAIVKFKVIHCPSNYVVRTVDNSLYCEVKEFPLSVIIGLSVFGAILFFIVGLSAGIFIIYTGMKIMKKLRRLEKKEKAELEIEKKIIDKKVIFGESVDNTPLLEDDRNSNSHGSKKKKLSERKESFLIPVEELKVEKKIGEGGCGTVYSAKWGDNIVAIKSIKATGDEEEEDFEREVSMLSTLRHPNIVTFYGVTVTDTSKYMVIEYLSRGSLKGVIYNVKNGKETLSLTAKLNILIGISQGMNYLHTLKPNAILHRDLKPENVLLDSYGVCKVCDFGLSKIIGTATQTMTTNVGTLFYLSPEMLKGDNPSSITSKLDVYSFSIIMWELFFEENAYNNSNSSKINYFNHSNELPSLENIFLIPSLVVKGLRPVIPYTTEEEKEIWVNEFIIPFESNCQKERIFILVDKYIQLMKECWSENPNDRPSFAEIIPQLKELKQYL